MFFGMYHNLLLNFLNFPFFSFTLASSLISHFLLFQQYILFHYFLGCLQLCVSLHSRKRGSQTKTGGMCVCVCACVCVQLCVFCEQNSSVLIGQVKSCHTKFGPTEEQPECVHLQTNYLSSSL